MPPNELPTDRYRRELRDLLAAGLDFTRFPPFPTRGLTYWRDCLRAAEHVDESYLSSGPVDADTRCRMWVEVVDDILLCVEERRWEALRPTPWAARRWCEWWDRMNWVDRTLHLVRGGRVPVAGDRVLRNRPLNPWANLGISLLEWWVLASGGHKELLHVLGLE